MTINYFNDDLQFEKDPQFTVLMKQELIFVMIFILFIFSWISVEVVGRALNNFTFKTLKLNENSTFHTTVIAIVVVTIELIFIYYFKIIGIPIYDPIFTDSETTEATENNGTTGNNKTNKTTRNGKINKKINNKINKIKSNHINDGDRGIGNTLTADIFAIKNIIGITMI